MASMAEQNYVAVQEAAKPTEVPGQWRELPYSDAVVVNPPVSLQRGERYPFVSMAAVDADSPSTWAEEEREFKGSGSRFQTGDTLMARITPSLENGKIARYQATGDKEAAHGSTEFMVIRGRPGVTDDEYAYYLTSWSGVRDYAISQMTGTSGRQRVPVDSLDHLIVPLPPLPEQRAIAHVLGTLDDKIELNRRMNETLEEMARSLFKSWFVDFEPVRAKMDDRWRRGESLPCLPAEHYDLFPDRLVPSELGEIPEGWEVKPLGECIDVTRGLSYKGSGLASTGVPMHNLNSIYEGGGYKEDGIKCYNGDFKDRHVTRPGDVLVANTEQGHDRLLIGFAAIAPKHLGDEGLFSHHLYRVRPNGSSGLSTDYLCQLFNTQSMHAVVSGYATGTTVNMLPFDALRVPCVATPPTQLVNAFSGVAKSIRERQCLFITECKDLAVQRESLLPGLVSGLVMVDNVPGFKGIVSSAT